MGITDAICTFYLEKTNKRLQGQDKYLGNKKLDYIQISTI